jgi:uncharacterized protein YbjT (DUF2867 family)
VQQHLGQARHGVIAPCGATGELGGRVAARLSERGLPIRMIVRDPARAPQLEGAETAVAAGYHDTDEMTGALRGADAVFMVSGRESPNRLDEHKSAVDAAARAGVRRIVYTSFASASPDTHSSPATTSPTWPRQSCRKRVTRARPTR